VEALLDNIRSIYNVGSIFRTADGAGVRRLHLCGITPTPAHPKVAKTALGAEQAVPWRAYNNAIDAVMGLKEEGFVVLALEEGVEEEKPSFLEKLGFSPDAPILLVVGNEIAGIDPGVLALADRCLAIPMRGVKRSLNVATAFGIAAYWMTR
jgi:tRNA G18 (ribose-2'-O)-methylase SpoU